MGQPRNQSFAMDVTTCAICGEVEQTEKMTALDETCLSVQSGDTVVGELVCADCYEEE